MIRKMTKLGSIPASAGGFEQLSVPIGHKGTFCAFYLMPRNGTAAAASVAVVNAAIAEITLRLNEEGTGNFNILPQVPPSLLYFRELFYAGLRGVANSGTVITYDPSAAWRAGEAGANIRNIGTANLKEMVIALKFQAAIAGLTHVDVYADIDYNQVTKLGAHTRIEKINPLVAGSGGKPEITSLTKIDKNFGYEAIHLHYGALTDLTISDLSLYLNGSNAQFTDIPVDLINRSLVEAGRAPQAGYTSLDFAKEDSPLYFLDGGMGEIKLVPNFVDGGAGADGYCPIWCEIVRKG